MNEIAVSMLFVHGSESQRWFSLIVDEFINQIPDASKLVLKDVCHDGVSKKPLEFAEIVVKYISQSEFK